MAKGYVVLPKSVTPTRITSNLQGAIAAYKALTKEDIEQLDGLASAGKQKRFITPPWRKCLSVISYTGGLTIASAAVDLGFRNWPGHNPLIL